VGVRALDRGDADAEAAALFEEMLLGWRRQQLARNLSPSTIETGARVVRRFARATQQFPWSWTSAELEAWVGDLREDHGVTRSTVRAYELCVRSFLAYVCDPAYGFAEACERRFGAIPTQVVTAMNLARHRVEHETSPRRRPLTRAECQALFDAADARVEAVAASGRKGTAAAIRDATMLKIAYAFGLRRRELLMLEVDDLGENPKAPEFGHYGVLHVRHAKATAGSGPRRRSVLTVMDWSAEVLAEWVETCWPSLVHPGTRFLWPSERNPRVSEDRFNVAFARLSSDAGLPAGLSPHCLRHSYVTHLVEDGFDALFVQQQVGHEHSSTTSIYTSVSSDYKTRVLRAALDRALRPTKATGSQ
jgi:integrase/recombinase XerC